MVSRRRTDALRVDVDVQACLSGASLHHHFRKSTRRSQAFSTAKGERSDMDGRTLMFVPRVRASSHAMSRRVSGVVGDRSGRICVRSSWKHLKTRKPPPLAASGQASPSRDFETPPRRVHQQPVYKYEIQRLINRALTQFTNQHAVLQCLSQDSGKVYRPRLFRHIRPLDLQRT